MEQKPLIETLPIQALVELDTEAFETRNIQAQTLITGEIARRAMLGEIAYDANDGTADIVTPHIDEQWMINRTLH